MAFPQTLDNFTNPTPSTPTNSPVTPLSGQLSQLNNAVEAIEAVIGVTGSTVPTSLEYRLADVQAVAAAALPNTDAAIGVAIAGSAQKSEFGSYDSIPISDGADSDELKRINLVDLRESIGVSVTTPPGRFLIQPPVSGITTTVSANCTVNESAQATLNGETVWKVTATSVGASQYVELNLPTQNAFSATDSTVEMYVDDPTKVTTIAQYLGTASYTKNVVFSQTAVNSPTTTRAPRMKGWNAFQTSKSQWTKNAALSGLEIGDQAWTQCKVRVFLAADVTTTVYLRAIHVNATRKSRIAITWDDGYDSVTQLGAPILSEYRLCSTMAIIPVVVGTAGNSSLSDLQQFVAAGNACCPHGPNAGNGSGSLFSVYADNASRIADVIGVRDYIVNNGLARRGSENCYVWPQGVFCESTTNLSFLDVMLQNGFVMGRGITATMNQNSRVAVMAPHNGNRMVLNIVGHSWSSSDEATNISTIISRIQAAAADGYDCILMLHKVVGGEDTAAASLEISANKLRAICAAIETLVAAGTMQDVLLPDLAT